MIGVGVEATHELERCAGGRVLADRLPSLRVIHLPMSDVAIVIIAMAVAVVIIMVVVVVVDVMCATFGDQ